VDSQTSPTSQYGAVAQIFHWLIAIVVLIAFIYGPGGSEHRIYLPARDFDRQLHETLGVCVFTLAMLRLLWRLTHRPPETQGPGWMRRAAKIAHGLLYSLLFLLPITAISGAWLEGHPLTLLAGVQVAAPFGISPDSHDLGAQIAEVHSWLGDVIMWLAGAHALAAIYHHLMLKDGVLNSMLPSRLQLRSPK